MNPGNKGHVKLFGGLEHFLFFHVLGISSSQLTNIFQRVETTNQLFFFLPDVQHVCGLSLWGFSQDKESKVHIVEALPCQWFIWRSWIIETASDNRPQIIQCSMSHVTEAWFNGSCRLFDQLPPGERPATSLTTLCGGWNVPMGFHVFIGRTDDVQGFDSPIYGIIMKRPNWGSHVFQVLLNYSAWAFNGVRASIRKSMQLMVLGDFPILFG